MVTKQQPAIDTTATASVTIGGSISDTATLSNATADAGGNITFSLYSDDACANLVTTLGPVAVTGNGSYGSGSYTPAAAGTYYWIASYSGDDKNLPVAGACGDAGETSVVTKAPSSVTTAQRIFPQDSATIGASAGGTPAGTVTFELYAPTDTTCSAATPEFTQTVALSGGTAATDNTTFSVTTASASTYRWKVTYSGDDTHDGSTGACGTEQFTLTIVNG